MTFRIKQHDLEPPLVIDVSGSAGDLTGVESWKVIGKRGSTEVFTDTAPGKVVNDPPTSAVITHIWQPGETNVPGVISIEVEATWPGDRPQTFPPDGYSVVRIEPDLG
ncbi:MAG TPA: hypothetical protein VG497_30640 [Kribbella sp.]|nr:hypothetical protein [Kribbella sp.]